MFAHGRCSVPSLLLNACCRDFLQDSTGTEAAETDSRSLARSPRLVWPLAWTRLNGKGSEVEELRSRPRLVRMRRWPSLSLGHATPRVRSPLTSLRLPCVNGNFDGRQDSQGSSSQARRHVLEGEDDVRHLRGQRRHRE